MTLVRGNVDQRIERKAPPQQFLVARLRDAAMICCFKPRPALALNQRRDFVHPLRAKAQVGSQGCPKHVQFKSAAEPKLINRHTSKILSQ